MKIIKSVPPVHGIRHTTKVVCLLYQLVLTISKWVTTSRNITSRNISIRGSDE